jgi:hypothetical protein
VTPNFWTVVYKHIVETEWETIGFASEKAPYPLCRELHLTRAHIHLFNVSGSADSPPVVEKVFNCHTQVKVNILKYQKYKSYQVPYMK